VPTSPGWSDQAREAAINLGAIVLGCRRPPAAPGWSGRPARADRRPGRPRHAPRPFRPGGRSRARSSRTRPS